MEEDKERLNTLDTLIDTIASSSTTTTNKKKNDDANKTNFKRFDTLHISLIYKINNFGPKTDPCGTPQVIFRHADL